LLLTSSAFFIFLAALFLLYWPAARYRRLATAVLFAASCFFLAKWDVRYLAILPAAALIDYGIGLALGRWRSVWLVLISVAMNVALIATSLPISLSFYAFQAMSYTIDVYRKDAKPIRGVLAYLTSATFFPTLLAGPITRPASLAPQLEKFKPLAPEDGGRALFLLGLGMAKKLLIADYLGENLVNRVFDAPKLYSGFEALVAVYAYAFQLYYDFSGYSDVAIGAALLLGLKLPPNFNAPYSASNLADFWRRWHMTLSNWLRDYVYFSFPGLRSTAYMQYVALVATMLIGGVWHGATWNFAIWGTLHGVGLAIVRAWPREAKSNAAKLAASLATFHFVCFGWIFFRASTVENALGVIARIGSLTFSAANVTLPIAVVVAVGALAHFVPKPWFETARDRYAATPFYVQAAALMLLVIGLQYIASTGAAPFIYTRF
jgi:D-alanyl-lipoteichoic acid acyltransferase DltB (MBOAT superfamily)